MPSRFSKAIFAAMFGFAAVGSISYVEDAEALWPLSYQWACGAYSPTQVVCDFTITSSTPPAGYRYQWLFGDGSQTGLTTSTTVTHYYAVSRGQEQAFTVTLVGYSSPTPGISPDNIVACSVVAGNSYGVGGDPGTGGNCQ